MAEQFQVTVDSAAEAAEAYFERAGTLLSLTADNHQSWNVPETAHTLPAAVACRISHDTALRKLGKLVNIHA